ncbi:hypothetical protein KCU65_g5731, partial [Aureobasidium melanogenum]
MAMPTTPAPLPAGVLAFLPVLPAEIYAEVVSHLINNRPLLEWVIAEDCPATDEARRLCWSTATPENGLLALLEIKPSHQRQSFANLLREITIRFKAPGDHHEGRDLQYPRLRSVTVVHDQVLMGREPYTYARVKRFMGPRLRNVEVGCPLHEGMNVKPTTDNFLPLLAGCPDLRSLTLRARVKHATPGDLVAVLNNCTNLRSLSLEKYTEPLIDENTIHAIANHPTLCFLHIDKHLNTHLLSLVANAPRPFEHITSLHLCINASAAQSILPYMEKLQMLELEVFSDYSSSVFPCLSTLVSLESLYIQFHNEVLRDDDLTRLTPLKRLQFLELAEAQPESDDENPYLNTSLVRPDLFAAVLGSLPCLESFTLHASHTFSDTFLLALGRNGQALRYLTLCGPFTLEPLAPEQAVLFPQLLVLELGRVDSAVPLRNGSAFREAWGGGIARVLGRHAPQLQDLFLNGDGDGGMGNLVQETWEDMIEELNG